MGLFMFKYHNDLLPDIFNSFFIKNNEYHSYPTRNAAKLRVPLSKTLTGSKFIRITGVAFWNLLENQITGNHKIGALKKLLKTYIIGLH